MNPRSMIPPAALCRVKASTKKSKWIALPNPLLTPTLRRMLNLGSTYSALRSSSSWFRSMDSKAKGCEAALAMPRTSVSEDHRLLFKRSIPFQRSNGCWATVLARKRTPNAICIWPLSKGRQIFQQQLIEKNAETKSVVSAHFSVVSAHFSLVLFSPVVHLRAQKFLKSMARFCIWLFEPPRSSHVYPVLLDVIAPCPKQDWSFNVSS